MSDGNLQPGILAGVPEVGRSLSFSLAATANPRAALKRLCEGGALAWSVVGWGSPLVRALGLGLPGLVPFPSLSSEAAAVPSTQHALWVFVRAGSRGELFDRSARVRESLEPDLLLADSVETFCYQGGRDLSGYEDGTENPTADKAREASVVPEGPLAGGSFVAVQRWVHDLSVLRGMSERDADHIIGRARSTNLELADAPESAHVKRAAQESFDPVAFMVRRSMPWAEAGQEGLEFVAYVSNLDAFERVLRRMVGLEDGIVDALFRYSRPVTGGYYYCPPTGPRGLDLRALGWE